MDNREIFIKMGSITIDMMIEIISKPSIPIKDIEDRYFNDYGFTFNKAFFIALISQIGIILNGDTELNISNYSNKKYLDKIELTKSLFSSFKSTNEIIVSKKDVNDILKNIDYDDAVSFLLFIKDKLANGMFEYDFFKDGIIIGGKTIPYNILDLCSTCIFCDHVVKDKPGYVDFEIVKIDPTYQLIDSKNKIDSMLNKIKIIKINISPKDSNIYLPDDINYLLYQKLIKIKNNNEVSSEEVSSLYDDLLEIVQSNNLKYSHQIISLGDYDLEEKNNLIKFINNNGEIFYNSQIDIQKHYLTRLVGLFNMPFHDYFNEGILLLKELKNYMGKSFSFNDIKVQNMDYSLNDNQLLISLVLMKFYIIYAYNRESEYDDYLDYSALDLSMIDSRINEPLIDDKILNRNYDSLTNIELLKLKRKRKVEETDDNYLDLKIRNGRLMRNINMINIEKSRVVRNFKLEPLNRDILYNTLLNRSILMHIKNSICNGNISFNKFATDKDDSVITFSDYKNDKLSYIGSVNFSEFARMCDYNLIKNNLKKN